MYIYDAQPVAQEIHVALWYLLSSHGPQKYIIGFGALIYEEAIIAVIFISLM